MRRRRYGLRFRAWKFDHAFAVDVGGGDPEDVAGGVRCRQAGLDVIVGPEGERACAADEAGLAGFLG